MNYKSCTALLAVLALFHTSCAQDTLGFANGVTAFTAGRLTGSFVKDSQTLSSLKASNGFDFLPLDFLSKLASNKMHHLGDVSIRYRSSSSGSWTSVDTASARKKVTPLTSLGSNVIAGADLAATLPSGMPLKITREWLKEGNGLAVRFNITNTGSTATELGALGFPIAINNIFNTRTAENIQDKCSLADPYIGLDAGYVRVSPVRGTGNALVITPLGASQFEAWNFLDEPQGNYWYRTQTYEGTYEWQIHSLAYSQNEWKNAKPWNLATSKTLQPGQVYSVGLKFLQSASIQTIEDAVVESKTPLAVGIPGYVIPRDMTARLYLRYTSAVKSIDGQGAFTITALQTTVPSYSISPAASAWGRNKVVITYADGKVQTVHYFITKSAPETVSNLGNFLTTAHYFTDKADPFGRGPSIMGYDRDLNKIVEQDSRVWIAGLSDEGGTGAYVAAAMKEYIQPVSREVAILDEFVQQTVVGDIQPSGSYGIRASIFYYQPGTVSYSYNPSFDWTSWTSWNKERAYTTRRGYNYVHPVTAYYSLYRIARDYPDTQLQQTFSWYLNRAYNTIQYCLSNKAANCDYGLTGLMGERVFADLLEDLKREGMTTEVSALEATMKYRANFWNGLAVPFGSEMAWDSTGQEGVYYWANYFGLTSTATKAINSIVAYMPTVAHWGWNGNARRYWDFNYGAKLTGTERQIHHYGSGLNSMALLHYFERNPTDFNALRTGFGGNTAPLTNIDEAGFASAAFHSFPQTMRWDPYTGDYGLGFLGLALGQTMYIVSQGDLGDVVYGGNVISASSASIVAEPRDAVRRRVFVAGLGLKVTINAGAIKSVAYDRTEGSLTLSLVDAVTSSALKAKSIIVWLEEPAKGSTTFTVVGAQKQRNGFSVSLSNGSATAKITKA